jgi:hypothetical protein
MSIKISTITGMPYDTVADIKTWHNSMRLATMTKLSKMFDFELRQPDTLQNIIQSIEKLSHMYHEQGMSPCQLIDRFNWTHTSDIGSFLKLLGIPLRNLSQSINNYNKTVGKEITDEKEKYWAACKFKFSNTDIEKIPGFPLLKQYGMYHPVKNLNGVSRDHIISISDAYNNGYDSKYIGHAANCRFMLHSDNMKKHSNSMLTYDELIDRVEYWEQGKIKELQDTAEGIITTKRKPLTEEHKKSISNGLFKRGKTETSSKKGKIFGTYKCVLSNIVTGEIIEVIGIKRWSKDTKINVYSQSCDWKIIEKYRIKTGERLI